MGSDYQRLCEFENLYMAFKGARRGKRSQENVAGFERNLESELFTLQEQLLAKTYQPGAYRSFYRTEAKRRLISAAPFRDRVVHHALINIIEPIFERRFVFDTYANRKEKGTHRALNRCTKFMRSSRYVLQSDVRQFFPSIDHTILTAQLTKAICNDEVLWLCDQIMATGVGVLDEVYEMCWFPGDDLLAACRPRGLPIGNLTSQFWANVYLNPLDQFVKRVLKCRRYIRYVDDFLLFADDKVTLHRWRSEIITFLAGFRLTIHENTAQVRPVNAGMPFLGFIVYPDHRRLKPARGYDFRRRLNALAAAYKTGEIDHEYMNASVQGWVAHAEHGDTWGLRRAVLSGVVL